MQTVSISRLQTRFAAPTARSRVRLLRLPALLVESALADAADAAGVFGNEHICVRRVQVSTRFDLTEPDEQLLQRWATIVTRELTVQIQRGGEHVQRYPSSRAALLDLVLSASRGDRRRAWAWRQLGYPVQASTARMVYLALEREAEAVPSVLAAAHHAGDLPAVIALLSAIEWTALAAEALARIGRPRAWAEAAWIRRLESRPAPQAPTVGLLAEPMPLSVPVRGARDIEVWAQQVMATALGRALQRGAPRLQGETHAALAVLLTLGALPGRVRTIGPRAPQLFAAVERALLAPSAPPSASSKAASVSPSRSADPPEPTAPVASTAEPAETPEGAIEANPRPAGWTDHAGLLFLLHLLEPHVEAVFAALPDRPLTWSLHALAMALLPLADTDPVALAFAGLAPDALPPNASHLARPIAPAEQAELEAIAASVRAELAEYIEDQPLEMVCARRGLIEADPGWFSVHLDLDAVDTAVRRVGLDLNVGHVPWLGIVVEFVYD